MQSIIRDLTHKNPDIVKTIPYQDYSSAGDGKLLRKELTATGKWINLIHNYFVHLVYNVKFTSKNNEIGYDFGEPKIIVYHDGKIYKADFIDEEDEWFIRLDNCSARESKLLPVKNIKDVPECITSSLRCNLFLMEDFKQKGNPEMLSVDVYLIPWRLHTQLPQKMERRYEFRATVCNNELTTICQYYRDMRYTLEEINHFIPMIYDMTNNFIGQYKYLSEYVIDLFVKPGHETIIEINSFGTGGVCGLPLFDWVKDHDQIYGKNIDILEIRYLSK